MTFGNEAPSISNETYCDASYNVTTCTLMAFRLMIWMDAFVVFLVNRMRSRTHADLRGSPHPFVRDYILSPPRSPHFVRFRKFKIPIEFGRGQALTLRRRQGPLVPSVLSLSLEASLGLSSHPLYVKLCDLAMLLSFQPGTGVIKFGSSWQPSLAQKGGPGRSSSVVLRICTFS